MFSHVDHVGLCVQDMDKAIAFYGDVIGMEKVIDRDYEMGRLIGVEGATARVVHMKFGESMVELFQYHHPEGRGPRPDGRQRDCGLIHIGFIVEDFQSTPQHLLDRGVEFLGEAVEVRPDVWVAYFRGCEGEVCEIREIGKS